ncbi:MAG: hypothetical protein UV36_C0007G0010 [Parcubacteria group bacterium GW2011_GWC2_42_6]|nr:MAG: hypothetical protein UU87_C0004G0023 [Parcubacteria group bacterium GW2011_GWA2_42_11]KKS67488.1 MAG: hypothetical protein UV36_C0007G0010 [Parcubacteria group bacterium GW2011_GWC2_42_6]
MAIKIIYTVFLSLMVALFVGLGISAFYPGPATPDYPIELQLAEKGASCPISEETKTAQIKFDNDNKIFMEAFKIYNRNVSIIALVAAIIILILSLTLLSKINMIADGILLGGVFAAAYSIIRGLMSQDTQFRFIIVVVGLVIALVLGYIKFIRPKTSFLKK